MQILVDNVSDSALAVLNVITADKEQGETAAYRRERGVGGARAIESPASGAALAAAGDAVSRATTLDVRDAGRALSKDIGQLRRLVQAAITALQIAEKEDEERTNGVAAANAEAEAEDNVAVDLATAAGSADQTVEQAITMPSSRCEWEGRREDDPQNRQEQTIPTIFDDNALDHRREQRPPRDVGAEYSSVRRPIGAAAEEASIDGEPNGCT